jgi:hypothetical protein
MTPSPPTCRETAPRLAVWLSVCAILSVTVFQKLAIPGSDRILWLSQALLLLVVLVGLARKAFIIAEQVTVASYLGLIFFVLVTILLKPDANISLSSLALLVVAHAIYLVRFDGDESIRTSIETAFLRVCLLLAGLGFIQFGLQFIVGTRFAFFIDYYFPAELVIKGYNNLNAVKYGSSIFKSNAFVLVEPASLNQLLALGLLVNFLRRGAASHTCLLLAGIVVTFSGTGLIVLFALLPSLLVSQGRFFTLAAAALLLVIVYHNSSELGLEIFISRSAEISSPGSSGYARFVSGGLLLRDHIFDGGLTQFIGRGPGTVREFASEYPFDIFTPTVVRVIYEYGLVGGLYYLWFMTRLILRPNIQTSLKLGFWLTFMIMSDYTLVPMMHGLIAALMVWPPTRKMPPAHNPAKAPFLVSWHRST